MPLELPLTWVLFPVFAILIYWPCRNGPLIFDDHMILMRSEDKFRWSALKDWRRPIPTALIAFQRFWRKISPGHIQCRACEAALRQSLHFKNMFLHGVNAVLVSEIASLYIKDAWIAGLVFLVHPFAVHTTAYITGQASLLTSFFGFAAILSVLTFHPFLSLLFLAAAALSKEDGAGFGILAGILAFLTGQYLFALGLAAIGVRVFLWMWPELQKIQKNNGDDHMRIIGLPVSHPQPDHFWTVLLETALRWPIWFFGIGQSPYYGSGISVPSWKRSLCFGLFTGILGGSALAFPELRHPLLMVAVGPWWAYLFCRVPDQLFDYRNYPSLLGFALLWGMVLSVISPWFLVGVVAAFAVRSCLLSVVWSDAVLMWNEAAAHTAGERSRAFQEIGAHYKLRGDNFNAKMAFKDAIEANPKLAPAINNLAWVHMLENEPDQGIALMEHLVTTSPDYSLGWHDLGVMYQDKRPDDAIRCYQKAYELDPYQFRPLLNRIGLILFYQQKYDQAREWFDKALEVVPASHDYLFNKAITLQKEGKHADANSCFQKLPQPLRLSPEMIQPEMAR